MSLHRQSEGLGVARLVMVLSSISPLFILWAIRGNNLIPDHYFILFCALMVGVPNGFLYRRIAVAKRLRESRTITVGTAEDHKDHLLVYLFAMLLPFYSANMETWRDLAVAIAALGFIVFLFWHLNLHYMNLFFAFGGYRVFTVYPPSDDNPISGKVGFVLITPRATIIPGEKIVSYRISNTVYFEGEK